MQRKSSERAPKQTEGKLDFSLLPARPLAFLVHAFQVGMGKYGRDSWRRGMPASELFAAMQRHAWRWWAGEDYDPEDGHHHLAAVAWCALCLIEILLLHPDWDDRVKQSPPW